MIHACSPQFNSRVDFRLLLVQLTARQLFKTAAWWEALLKSECGEACEIAVKEAECFETAWQEWFDTGHEYGIRDREFLQKGLDKILNFVLIYVRKN